MRKKGSDKEVQERLSLWKQRTENAVSAYSSERDRMDVREAIYKGRKELDPIIDDDVVTECKVPWNIVFELIESQVDSNIPTPKVEPLRSEDERLARLIEDVILNKLDELPSELINDETERTVPKQGGSLIHVEWDSEFSEALRHGRSTMTFVHPKNLVPQPGVTSDIEDMDWCGIDIGVTKSFVKKRWGVDVTDETEEQPSLRGPGEVQTAEDMVTVRLRYFRNENGGIGKYVYCNDIELEYFEDYQSRHNEVCAKCGRPKQLIMSGAAPEAMPVPTLDGTYPGGGEWNDESGIPVSETADHIPSVTVDPDTCPWCGSKKWVDGNMDYEEVWAPFDITDDDGNVILSIPGEHYEENEDGVSELVPTKIPFYVPNIYPLLLIKNVSAWGKLLGESDVDMIEGQQNAINRLNQKLLDSVLKGGSVLMEPEDPSLDTGNGVSKVYRTTRPEDKDKFGVFTMEPNIGNTVQTMQLLYEQARNTIGITDAFQGRQDNTANSGKAKQISVAQSSGRFASKRVMKKYGYSKLFEALFKFELAYSDDKRPVVGRDKNGMHRDETWNRWRFLRQDSEGNYYWNTDFLFSADIGTTLETDRPAMWEEVFRYFEAGALGAREDIGTQVLFWRMLEHLHYPHAADIKEQLIDKQQQQSELAAQASLEGLEAINKTGGVPV